MKNYSKKQKILFGILLVFIFMFSSVGTYAYFEKNVGGNDNASDQVVSAGVLDLTFMDGPQIIGSNVEPGQTYTKKISVKNTGSVSVSYNIGWKSLVNEIINDELVYSWDCTSYSAYYGEGNANNVTSGTCGDMVNSPVGNDADSKLATDVPINAGIIHVYMFNISFIDTSSNQNYNQGKIFTGELQVDEGQSVLETVASMNVCGISKNFSSNNSLAYKVLSDNSVNKNCGVPTYNKAAVSQSYYSTLSATISGTANNTTNSVAENGIYKSTDNDGATFFYRGKVENNYVKFAGLPWRIVRINGDNSVRLVLDGTANNVRYNQYTVDGINYGAFSGSTTYYNASGVSDTGAGPSSGSAEERTNAISYASYAGGSMKDSIDTFYDNYLEKFDYHLKDTTFCSDTSFINETDSRRRFTTSSRLFDKSYNSIYNSNTFMCDDDYEYTVANGKLTAPVATLSSDEVVAAGGAFYVYNDQYYLYNSSTINGGWTTMSPAFWNSDGQVHSLCVLGSNSYKGMMSYFNVATEIGYRPVINLKSTTNVSGSGTSSDPYVVVSGREKINTNTLSDTVVVGDSRVVGMSTQATMPSNITAIATGGATVADDFTNELHYGQLKTLLNNNSSKRYNIVLEYGVNDMGYVRIIDTYVEKYTELLNYLPAGHKVYILNVFPINPDAVNFDSIATNAMIEQFNTAIYNYFIEHKNVRICDIYHAAPLSDWKNLYLNDDGVHLTNAGARFMLSTIQNCVAND